MEFTLMYTDSPNNMLEKNYTVLGGYSGTMRAAISALRPVIDVEIEDATTTVMQANYAYIQTFDRFYFIRNKTALNNKLWRFELETDVLMSFHEEIGQLEAVVERQTDNYDMYLPDPQIPVDCRKTVSYRKFPTNQFGLPYLYMVVLGGDN